MIESAMIGCLQNESASVSASSKSLRFILSLRLYFSYIFRGQEQMIRTNHDQV